MRDWEESRGTEYDRVKIWGLLGHDCVKCTLETNKFQNRNIIKQFLGA
jgi:hypothetical protein